MVWSNTIRMSNEFDKNDAFFCSNDKIRMTDFYWEIKATGKPEIGSK